MRTKSMTRRLLLYCSILVPAGICIYWLSGDLKRLSTAHLAWSWDTVALAASLSCVNYALRSVRWRMYLKRLGHALPLRFTALTYVAGFAYTLLPGKMGELVRARYYAPRGIPLRDVAAAFFADRALDALTMLGLGSLMVLALARYRGAVIAAAILIGTCFLVIVLFPWERLRIAAGSLRSVPPLIRSLLDHGLGALASARPLLRPAPMAVGLSLGAGAWCLEGTCLWVLSSMYPDAHLSLGVAIGIYGLAGLFGALTFLPGGVGGTEAAMTALLAGVGFPVGEGLLITLTTRLVTFWLAVGLGWIAVAALRERRAEASG
jgi:glycosyltransferase 2 family protein